MTERQSYEKIEHLIDVETPENTGWYIVYYDPSPDGDDKSYDAIGPFDSHDEAKEVHFGCGAEPDLARAIAGGLGR